MCHRRCLDRHPSRFLHTAQKEEIYLLLLLLLLLLFLWKATGQEDINLEIRKRKFRWIGHTLREEDGEIPKAALHWNPQGKRKRGRPKIAGEDQ